MSDLWRRCLERLEGDFSVEDMHTYLKPLQATQDADGLRLLAPNQYTLDFVRSEFLARIGKVLEHLHGAPLKLRLEVGTLVARKTPRTGASATHGTTATEHDDFEHNLDPHYTFDAFVEGKSNQLGKAAAIQVATNPGRAYNPLLLYGGTGLGKTHLMHAAGNLMRSLNPATKVMYLRSEQFVREMIQALRTKSMDDFKRRFRAVDALLIDDIQFFAGKDSTQEEFFHTFNALVRGEAAADSDLRSLSEGSRQSRTASEIPARLGSVGRDRSAGFRNAHSHPAQQGGRARRSTFPSPSPNLIAQAHALQRPRS